MEIPAYRLPSLRLMARKLWIRIAEYFAEVFPLIVVGVLVINILDSLSVIRFVSSALGGPLSFLLGLPHDIAPVLILGFLRKDVLIALLAPFALSGAQFVIACVFMVLYVPCVASFFTITKELGVLSAMRVMAIVFGSALTICALLNWTFVLGTDVGNCGMRAAAVSRKRGPHLFQLLRILDMLGALGHARIALRAKVGASPVGRRASSFLFCASLR